MYAVTLVLTLLYKVILIYIVDLQQNFNFLLYKFFIVYDKLYFKYYILNNILNMFEKINYSSSS